MASLFSSVLKGKIGEMGFMRDMLIGQPNDKMTSYIQLLYRISTMCSLGISRQNVLWAVFES